MHDLRACSAAVLLAFTITMTDPADAADDKPVFTSGARVLFQGDSITDTHRGADDAPDAGLGHGYAFLVATRLSAKHPELRLVFQNRGVSGNDIHDLGARWEEDTIALRPDVLSILIGINDTAAEIALDEFEAAYDTVLERTKAALPHVRLVLCEPFALLPREANGAANAWEVDVRQRARIVEKLAQKYGASFVRFQQVFDDATKRAPAERWLYDGIHPTHAGHQLMADEWMRVIAKDARRVPRS